MEYLVLSGPVCTPAEPPSGAFILAAGLTGNGYDAGLFDLSLEFFHQTLDHPEIKTAAVENSVQYLLNMKTGYDPMRHRTAAGSLHKQLKQYSNINSGWKLTFMDITSPEHVHDPSALADRLSNGANPFSQLWEERLEPVLNEIKPKHVLISLAYLSQLASTIDLVSFLKQRGIEPIIGGSLPRSLATTGHGLDALHKVLGTIDLSNGASLIPNQNELGFWDRISWPTLVSSLPYLSAHPVVPFTLSTGCYWRRCLFCPDREMPFVKVPESSYTQFLSSIPNDIIERRPIVHLLDSAIPPKRLRQFLPAAREYGVKFYGFARPSEELTRDGLLEDAAEAGLLMLQLGVEGGSDNLLDRFDKGLRAKESAETIRQAAAAGIRTYLYLLFGLPGETSEHRQATLDLIESNSSDVDFMNLSLFNLPKYCELAQRAEEFEIMMGDYPGNEDVIHLYRPFTCGGISPREEARNFIDKSFLTTPSIREAHLRTPRWFRAAHLAMMKLNGRRDP